MWILWSILSGGLIATTVTIVKKYATTPINGYLIYMTCIATTVGWVLPYAYSIAPNFVYPYMIQSVALNIIGPIIGIFVFHDIISIDGWIGIVLMTIGSYLLVK